jgi:hypothetical protein
MSRIGLAFAAFFSLLFKGRLPEGAGALLLPTEPAEGVAPAPGGAPAPREAATDKPTVPELRPAAPPTPAAPRVARADGVDLRAEGALILLGLLQREGRLVDFLRERLDGYDDAAIGAAVRDIHRGCKKVLDEHLRIEPVMPGSEDAPVTVPRGFDPLEVRLIGEAPGAPPFRGTLVHHGWRALDVRFPTLSEAVDRRVLAPAEVRVS